MARAAALALVVVSDLPSWFTDVARGLPALGLPPPLGATARMAFAGLTLSLLADLAALPFLTCSRWILEGRYRASRPTLNAWVYAYAQTMGLHALVWAFAASVVSQTAQHWPGVWWGVTGGVAALAMIAMTHLGPAVVWPQLYELRPVDRPGLQARLIEMTRRLGASVVAIREWRLGPGRPSAALVGVGATRQVLLSDALLADYSDDEIEVVLAHELAHHLHYDIWQTLACEATVTVAACWVAHLTVGSVGPQFGIAGVGEERALPLMALAAGGVVMLCAPIRHLLSRRHERRADRYAMEVTQNPEALVSSLRRLADHTLAEDRPSRLVEWLYYSHPPTAERLITARAAMEDLRV